MGPVEGYDSNKEAPYLDTGVWAQVGRGNKLCVPLVGRERLERRPRERRELISPSQGDFPLRKQVVERERSKRGRMPTTCLILPSLAGQRVLSVFPSK